MASLPYHISSKSNAQEIWSLIDMCLYESPADRGSRL